MRRVAIVGSCITRDVWRFRGDPGADLLYLSRTSLASLLSPPAKGFAPADEPPAGLRPQPHRALVADIAKTGLARLLAFRPHCVIFDFIDERFDLLAANCALVTHSWELEVSGYLDQPALRGARPIARLSAACDRLWLYAAAEFAALVRATALAEARLVLHSARWAERIRSAEGSEAEIADIELLPGRPAEIAPHNRLLGRYEQAFVEVMPPLELIEASDLRVADGAHRWGLSPFHYIDDYYAAVAVRLEGLGVRFAREA